MSRMVWSVAALLLAGGIASAPKAVAEDRSSADSETAEAVRQLLRQVSELQQKVAALEARQAGPPAAEAPAAATRKAESEADPNPSELAAFQENHEVRGIRWRGFGEVNYKVLDQRAPEFGDSGFVPGSAGNFYTGDFDLFLTSKISDKTSVLAEIVVGEGDAQSFAVNVARALLKYDYSDYLRISAGRYHTGIGYYNAAFHSGKWLQTTADRPLVMEFADDGGLLPTQALGLSLTGQIPSGSLGLNYIAEYGSSDTLRPDIDGVSSIDENNGNHINLGFFLRPQFAPGLQIGTSYYHDRVSDFLKGSSVRLGQTIVNGHIVYAGHGLELLNEAFLMRETYEHGGLIFNMPAFYTQVSKAIGKVRPYFRYQYANLNGNSLYHGDVLLRQGASFGLRYEFNESVALKTQLDHTIRRNQPNLNGLQVQLAFAF